jgi:chromosome segregation ATPase
MTTILALEKQTNIERQLKQLQIENSELQEDVRELREQLRKEQHLKTSLQQSNDILKSENEQLKEQITKVIATQQQNERIVSNNNSMTSFDELPTRTTSETSLSSIVSFENEIPQYKKKEEEYLLQIKLLQEKNEALSEENKRLTKRLYDYNLVDSQTISEKLEETTKLLLENQKIYNEQLQEIRKELKRKQNEISSVQENERKLSETIQQLNKDIQEKQKLITSLEQDLYNKIKNIEQLQNEITQLKLAVEQKQSEVVNCKEKLHKMEEHIQDLTNRLKLKESELKKQQQNYQEEMKELCCELERKEQKIIALQKEVIELKETFEQKEQELLIDSQIAQLEVMNPDIELEIKLKCIEEENMKLKEENQKLQRIVEKEKETVNSLLVKMNDKTQGKCFVSCCSNSMMMLSPSFLIELEQKVKRINELENEIQSLKSKFEKFSSNINTSEKTTTNKFLDFGY